MRLAIHLAAVYDTYGELRVVLGDSMIFIHCHDSIVIIIVWFTIVILLDMICEYISVVYKAFVFHGNVDVNSLIF